MRSTVAVFLAFLVCFVSAADPGYAKKKQIAPVPQSGEKIRSDYGLSGQSGWMLIDLDTGDVIEFRSDRIEALQREIAEELGYEIEHHRLELYGRKLKD